MLKKLLYLIIWLPAAFILYVLTFAISTPSWHPGSASQDRDNILKAGASGERIRCIDDNEEALEVRLRIINEAKKEIVLSTFDFHPDNSGTRVMAALLKAADRGVKVRVLVDGISEMLQLKHSKIFRAFAAHENIEVRIYNRINLLMPWRLNYRLHDKYLMADDIYITGGRNTYDLFLGNYSKSRNQDRDILVYGEKAAGGKKSVEVLRKYSEKIWKSRYCSRFKRRISEKDYRKFIEKLEKTASRLSGEFPGLKEAADWEKLTYSSKRITLLVNPVQAGYSEASLWHNLCTLMKKGKKIYIQTPYIICSREMYRDLREINSKAEQISIMTNAVESGANPFGCTDYISSKKKILGTGTNVYEYLGEHSMHTKTVLIDDDISVVGSFNVDERSAYLDTEMMMVIEGCPEVNISLRKEFEDMKKRSLYVDSSGKETKGEDYVPVTPGADKKFFYGTLRIIIHPFRYLL